MNTTAEAVKDRPILFSAPMVKAILAGRKTQTRRMLQHQPHQRSDGTWSIFVGKRLGSLTYETNQLIHRQLTKDKKTLLAEFTESMGLTEWLSPRCPYGRPGERLWVRETWRCSGGPDLRMIAYDAEGVGGDGCDSIGRKVLSLTYEETVGRYGTHKHPSIHMPRWASRLTLEVTSVRVERLHEITEADALAEGSQPSKSWSGYLIVDDQGLSSQIGENYVHGIPKVGDDWHGRKVTHVQHQPSLDSFTARDNFRSLWHQINGSKSWDANPWVWVVSFKRIEA